MQVEKLHAKIAQLTVEELNAPPTAALSSQAA